MEELFSEMVDARCTWLGNIVLSIVANLAVFAVAGVLLAYPFNRSRAMCREVLTKVSQEVLTKLTAGALGSPTIIA